MFIPLDKASIKLHKNVTKLRERERERERGIHAIQNHLETTTTTKAELNEPAVTTLAILKMKNWLVCVASSSGGHKVVINAIHWTMVEQFRQMTTFDFLQF